MRIAFFICCVCSLLLPFSISTAEDGKEEIVSLPSSWVEEVKNASYPLVQLHRVWQRSGQGKKEFLSLCKQMGWEVKPVLARVEGWFDVATSDGEWHFIDIFSGRVYLGWDNATLVSSDELMDDPLLVLRAGKSDREHPQGCMEVAERFAHFAVVPLARECIHATTEHRLEEKTEIAPSLRAWVVEGQEREFSYTLPVFAVESEATVSHLEWQISLDPSFLLVPEGLGGIDERKDVLKMTQQTATYLQANRPYFLRIRGGNASGWGEWSEIFTFKMDKPQPVFEVDLIPLEKGGYELNWEREAEETPDVEYWVYGSHSLDFIPDCFANIQLQGAIPGRFCETIPNVNLVAIVQEAKIEVDGTLPYYRIIAREKGCFSVPSPLIRVWGEKLHQQRDVLQLVEGRRMETGEEIKIFQRLPLSSSIRPKTYFYPVQSAFSEYFPQPRYDLPKSDLRLQAYSYPDVASDIWDAVRPHLIPDNHPAKPRLDRIFCASRATLDPTHFRKAGFPRNRPGRFSRVMASTHPQLQEYFVKAFADTELGILFDWKKWLHRIAGAHAIRECIHRHGYQAHFKVPRKWIYPLPKHPSPPSSSRYLRKNFVLVADNVRSVGHANNEQWYKDEISPRVLFELFTIMDEMGLFDSVYAFNVPVCKDGKIAFIDTEYHHRWPVPFYKFNRYLSKSNKKLWTRWANSSKQRPPTGPRARQMQDV